MTSDAACLWSWNSVNAPPLVVLKEDSFETWDQVTKDRNPVSFCDIARKPPLPRAWFIAREPSEVQSVFLF
jgi:hypothetical protein